MLLLFIQMNWTKPNFTQWVAIITLSASAIGYVWHSENDRIDGKIKQHDQEQRLDSVCTALVIFITEFKELRKNREATTIQRDKEKKEDDERTDALNVRVTIMETKWEDFQYYKLKK